MGGMMTGIIMRGATGVIIAIMIDATTHAMTVITIVVTRGGIATDITMTDTPTYGARIESVTPIDEIIAEAGGDECADSKKQGPAAGPGSGITNHQRNSPQTRLELLVHRVLHFQKSAKARS
jgi:hypothetical protein